MPSREGSTEYQDDLCDTLRDLAIIQRALGKLDDAFGVLQEAVDIADKLVESDPANIASRRSAAIAKFTYAGLLFDLNKTEAALTPATFAFATLQELCNGPDAIETDDNFAVLAASLLGRILQDNSDLEPAQKHYAHALKFVEPLKAKHSEHRRERFAISRLQAGAIELAIKTNQLSPETLGYLDEVKNSLQSLRRFKNRTYSLFEADAERLGGKILLMQNKPDEAQPVLNKAYTQVNDLLKQGESSSSSPEFIQVMTSVLGDQMLCRKALKDEAAVAKIQQQATELLQKAQARFQQCKRMLSDLELLTKP